MILCCPCDLYLWLWLIVPLVVALWLGVAVAITVVLRQWYVRFLFFSCRLWSTRRLR